MQAEISPTQHTHRIFENRENQWKQRLVQEPEPVRVGVCQCVRDTGTRENGRVLCCVRGLSILLNIEPLSLSGLSLGIGKSGLFKWWKKREIVFYTKNEKWWIQYSMMDKTDKTSKTYPQMFSNPLMTYFDTP